MDFEIGDTVTTQHLKKCFVVNYYSTYNSVINASFKPEKEIDSYAYFIKSPQTKVGITFFPAHLLKKTRMVLTEKIQKDIFK